MISSSSLLAARPDDAKALLSAKLIIKNGLGFEPWLDRLVTSTETKALVISASHGVIPRSLDEDGETIPDPHAWHNLANTELYIANITKALIAADPANSADYQRNSQAYLKRAIAKSSPPMTPSAISVRPTGSTSWHLKDCPPNVNRRLPKSLR